MTKESLNLTVSSNVANLGAIADFVTKAAQKANLDDNDTFAVQMAVDEACTNIIMHAYADSSGDIHLDCQVEPGKCVVTIRDHGRSFDPESVPPPDLTGDIEERRVGGLGLHFIRNLMDEVRFSSDPIKGNQVIMIKKASQNRQAEADKTFAIVAAHGRIDAAAAPDLESQLEALWTEEARIVVDMADVPYISSSGLKVLLAALRQTRRQQSQLVLCNLQPRVAAIFEMAGFDQVFAIGKDLKAAAQLLEQP